MPDRVFDPADYPHGLQCTSCHHPFTEGDPVRDADAGWLAGISWVSPLCVACGDAGRGVPGVVELLADGRIK